jgi:hypothetical protein
MDINFVLRIEYACIEIHNSSKFNYV